MSDQYSRGIRSFVKREGRLSSRVQRVWDELSGQFVVTSQVHNLQVSAQSLVNDVALQDAPSGDEKNANAQNLSANLSAVLFGEERASLPLVVEIGSGQGNQVVHAATLDSSRNYLALEVYHTGAAHTLLLMRNAGVDNVRVAELDAAALFQSGALNACIDELWTFFPDPWQKKRHHKRRLVNEAFFEVVKKCLKPYGVWYLSTDWEDYAKQMQDVLKAPPSERFHDRLLTNFEKKGIAAGRKIYDFRYTNG